VTELPHWLTPLPDAEAMRAVDRWAISERGVPSLDLMERAGEGVARAAEELAPDGAIRVFCGKGNNGGDGLVAARLLRGAGRRVEVVSVADPDELDGDARVNLERLPGAGPLRLDLDPWSDAAQAQEPPLAPAATVDALLGTGFAGEPRGAVRDGIEAVNAMGVPVLAVDVPSGVDASTGAVAGPAVGATVTVTFHAAKAGLWINPGKGRAGEVVVVDIGIPRGAPLSAQVGLIEDSIAAELPRRGHGWTKFLSGQVVVVGGSRGLSGAPAMAGRAGMRAGAGYVTVCTPAAVQPILATAGSPELMTRPLPEEDGAFSPEAVAGAIDALGRGGVLALGPGLGRTGGALAFARELAAQAGAPMVLDADGLNAHAGRLDSLGERVKPSILTPHAGELGRLLDVESAEIERERLARVREAARRARAVVVLKGDDSLVADAAGRVAVSAGGTPALATAGTGDVLTGVVAAMLAQGLDPFAAAAAGVWLHARAGRLAARRVGAIEGVVASDVIEALPAARAAAAPGWEGDANA
jgi:NAD(P)H-hydrate epimerase